MSANLNDPMQRAACYAVMTLADVLASAEGVVAQDMTWLVHLPEAERRVRVQGQVVN